MLSSADIQALRSEAHHLDPILQIGKSGLTDAMVEEVKRQLKRRKLIKLKLLKSAREGAERDALAQELAERTRSVLVEVRGNTVVLWKGRKPAAKAKAAPGDE